MKVTNGLQKMREDSMIPEGEYGWRIVEVRTADSGWEFARARIIDAGDGDKKLVGRTTNLILGNAEEGNFGGLMDLMMSKHWRELPEVDGEQDTEAVLPGVEFLGSIQHRDGRENLRPVVTTDDYAWFDSEEEGDEGEYEPAEIEEEEEEEEEPAPKPAARKKKAAKKSAKKKTSGRRR